MVKIKHLGHAGFKIRTKDSVIYIDPFRLENRSVRDADLILITHSHFDHCSPEDIEKIIAEKTQIVCSSDCRHKLHGNIKVMRPHAKMSCGQHKITSLPAYNINKQFHPKTNGWLGYMIETEGVKIYHAGDTDCIPEMQNLGHVDFALLPVGGKFTMDASEAARAADMINPAIAVPMHYGDVVGTKTDAEEFKRLCKCKVEFV